MKKLNELNPAQKTILKQNLIVERAGGNTPSWADIAEADEIISDSELQETYLDTEFTKDDFEVRGSSSDEDNRFVWMRGAFAQWARDLLTVQAYELDTKTAHSNADIKKAITWCREMVLKYLTGTPEPTKGYVIVKEPYSFASPYLRQFNPETKTPTWSKRFSKALIFTNYHEALKIGSTLFEDNVDCYIKQIG